MYEIGDRWQKAHVDKQRTHGKLKGKKIVHEMWKKGLSTCKEYRNLTRACRDVMRKAKALSVSALGREVKANRSLSTEQRRTEKVWACTLQGGGPGSGDVLDVSGASVVAA